MPLRPDLGDRTADTRDFRDGDGAVDADEHATVTVGASPAEGATAPVGPRRHDLDPGDRKSVV